MLSRVRRKDQLCREENLLVYSQRHEHNPTEAGSLLQSLYSPRNVTLSWLLHLISLSASLLVVVYPLEILSVSSSVFGVRLTRSSLLFWLSGSVTKEEGLHGQNPNIKKTTTTNQTRISQNAVFMIQNCDPRLQLITTRDSSAEFQRKCQRRDITHFEGSPTV